MHGLRLTAEENDIYMLPRHHIYHSPGRNVITCQSLVQEFLPVVAYAFMSFSLDKLPFTCVHGTLKVIIYINIIRYCDTCNLTALC